MNRSGRLLYICAPFQTAKTQEVRERLRAIDAALVLGWVPIFAPYLYAGILFDTDAGQRAIGLECAEAIVERCDALLIVGQRRTDGMRRELEVWRQDGFRTYQWPELLPP